jgi:hypothetical protein
MAFLRSLQRTHSLVAQPFLAVFFELLICSNKKNWQ